MLQPGAQLGIYRLIDRLGAGGMGEVWKGEDTRLGRAVAIKILPPALASDFESSARMRREARVAAQINHPNVATIHAFEEAQGRLFIVMELVAGVTLTELIRGGPLPEAEVCRIGRSVAEALAEAHAKGIVHRDIKPDNIMVDGSRVKVLDFGIAKQLEQKSARTDDPTAILTQQGFIIGTVYYMSPEQALGRQLDHRTDLFSLGVVLYQAASGTLPFVGETATDTITRIVRDEPAPPRGVTPGLAAVIRRCLQKERERRFASAGELADALERQLAIAPTMVSAAVGRTEVIRDPSNRRWPRILGAAGVVIVALGLVAAGVALQRRAGVPEIPAAVQAVEAPPASTTTVSVAAPAAAPEPARPLVVEETATATETIAAPATTEPAPAPPVAAPASVEPAQSADVLFNEGMARLVDRQPLAARDAFLRAIEIDPHHARAHFRLGEMALFLRDGQEARRELEAALADSDRLPEREKSLAQLGMALLDGDRPRAEQLLRDMAAQGGRNPDLERFRQLLRDGPRRPRRGPR